MQNLLCSSFSATVPFFPRTLRSLSLEVMMIIILRLLGTYILSVLAEFNYSSGLCHSVVVASVDVDWGSGLWRIVIEHLVTEL